MTEDQIKNNIIVSKVLNFAQQSMAFCDLVEQKRKYILSRQLFKASTSIGANIWEAQNAESKNDFIHKFKIAAKEADETRYWLYLCRNLNISGLENLLSQLTEIEKIIHRIITTAKIKNSNKK